MIKYPESSCLQQIFQIIKRRVPPSHKTDWVSIQQALRSPFQSIPTTSSFHIHKIHTSFSKAQKSNHSVKKKNATKSMGIWSHWEYSLPLFFCFFLLLSSSWQQPFLTLDLKLCYLSATSLLPPPQNLHTSLYIPTHPVAASKYPAAGHGLPTLKGTAEIFPPGFPFSITIRKLAADKGSMLAPGIKQWPKSRGFPCSPNKHNFL